MHPILARQFLEFFLECCRRRHQIIITTHESNLLDLDLLRRDEIWFAEKDQAGASHLYSLADFNVRTDQDIRKRYLQGRYGAIPFLGDLMLAGKRKFAVMRLIKSLKLRPLKEIK